MEELIEAGNNNPQESLDEIGQSLNLTTRRVEQLKDRAIARLVENEKNNTECQQRRWILDDYQSIIEDPESYAYPEYRGTHERVHC